MEFWVRVKNLASDNTFEAYCWQYSTSKDMYQTFLEFRMFVCRRFFSKMYSIFYLTLKADGYLVLPATQWAAVTTWRGPTIEPPQPPRPLYNIKICHGHEPRVAVTPAMTRWPWISGLPQAENWIGLWKFFILLEMRKPLNHRYYNYTILM